MPKFVKGQPRPANAGRKKGTQNRNGSSLRPVRARTAGGSGASTGHGIWLDADVHPWPATTRGAADDRSPSAAGSLARS